MSQLLISSRTQGFKMNVLAFSSPIFGSMSSAQTRTKAIHFPIKFAQPEIQFDVVFSSQPDYERFQRFVRHHQKQAVLASALLTLQWPERNIVNWTGVIKQFRGGAERFQYVPRARFVVQLVDSMASSRTDFASVSAGWRSIYGAFGPVGSVLRLPTLAEAQDILTDTGQDIFNRGISTTVPGTPAPTGSTPVSPVPPDGGILAGTG